MNGPLLFFTGGTALKTLSGELIRRGEPSVHVVTTFDSGGSSAELRRAFDMPAVGDIRNRILALSAEDTLLGHRLGTETAPAVMEFLALSAGVHPLLDAERPARRRRLHVLFGELNMFTPRDFDFRGASVGNLVLTALYRRNGNSLTRAACDFSRLTGARGLVRPVAETPAQLAVRLENGREIVGQHRFASKKTPLELGSPIVDVRLVDDAGHPVDVRVTAVVRGLVARAGLICYPVGSFFSSVVAGLLPRGVAEAVEKATCPKVFMPNPGFDPELEGVSFARQLAVLRRLLPRNGLTHVLTASCPEHRKQCPPDIQVHAAALDAQGNLDPGPAIEALCRIRNASCN